jgi:pimeloyl-ACP methyl ester carboxylesterase
MPTVETAFGPIFYLSRGQGQPPLIAVHGAGGLARHWGGQLSGLADLTQIVALDLPGHGRSPGPTHTTVDQGAERVLALLDALAIPRAVLMGHSMGGAIVQTLALRQPQRTAGLVLVGTGARLRVHPDILSGILADWRGVTEMITAWSYAPEYAADLLARAAADLRTTSPATLHADYSACDRFDLIAEAGRIAAPTLIIVGAQDRMTPPKYAEFLARTLPQAQLTIIEQAGHSVMIEQPQLVNEAIRTHWPWLSTPPAAPSQL